MLLSYLAGAQSFALQAVLLLQQGFLFGHDSFPLPQLIFQLIQGPTLLENFIHLHIQPLLLFLNFLMEGEAKGMCMHADSSSNAQDC